MTVPGRILVVDDHRTNRLKLSLSLSQQGHAVAEADTGRSALERLRLEPFDLVLLDILMPEMDGFQVLAAMKEDPALRDVPVIVISAQEELEDIVRGIELGAEDYLPKSFNPVMLRARIGACLEKKRLRDEQRASMAALEAERARSDALLLNVLPRTVADRLKAGERVIADAYPDASVLFADIVDFSPMTLRRPAEDTVHLLNRVFSDFDVLADRYGLEKIKTIGDAYMAVGGVPTPSADHLSATADMALEMFQRVERFPLVDGRSLRIRIGIHAGPVVAGIIGIRKFAYDLWGDTVNVASRMESHGQPGEIHVSDVAAARLSARYELVERGFIPVKGIGPMRTWFLRGRKADPAA